MCEIKQTTGALRNTENRLEYKKNLCTVPWMQKEDLVVN